MAGRKLTKKLSFGKKKCLAIYINELNLNKEVSKIVILMWCI